MTFVINNDVSEKLLKCKEQKGKYIGNVLNGEKLHTDKGYEVDSLDKVCGCYDCMSLRNDKNGFPLTMSTFIVCPVCGNKRCPKATYHGHECTNSNEPGQPGSRYAK